MSVVRTILGDIDSRRLGVTDAHEHLIRTGGGEVAHGGEDMRLPSVEKAVAETRMFLAAGGKTVVDTAPCSLGRDIRKLLEVSAQVDAHILASTGFDYDLTVFVPRLREDGSPEDAIEDMLVNNPARLFAIEK